MQDIIHWGSVAVLCGLLLVAAIGDIRRFIIPNWLNTCVAVLVVPFWLTSADFGWAMVGWQLLAAACVLLVFGGLFAAGWMGGGDVKLLVALALWLPWLLFIRMFLTIAVLGGALTAVLLILHRLRKREGSPEIPYGVAIAAGAILTFGEPLVKYFAG